MSTRSYLSIGDVLTLLRQEFPDITISKIRFLESQGLVNPERTPSGYRKFYEHDVERLRWVLRQQREHFLPLKVIKDRLDDDAADVASSPSARTAPAAAPAASTSSSRTSTTGNRVEAGSGGGPHAAEARHASEGRRAGEPVLVGHRASADVPPSVIEATGLGEPTRAVAGDGTTLPGIESEADLGARPRKSTGSVAPAVAHAPTAGARKTGTARLPGYAPPVGPGHPDEPTGRPAPVTPVGHDAGTAAASGAERAPAPTASAPSGQGPRDTAEGAVPKAGSSRSTPAATSGSGPSGAGSGSSATSSGLPDDKPRSRAKAGSSSAAADLGGSSLSVDELAAASGLEVAVLRELQEFGLLRASNVAGEEFFDEEALAVANLAAGFARFGVEPRHLRLYKNAADREAGFVEQIVLPLVRQRNPEARTRAHETADELARLGQELRASLLRTSLGDLLNG